MASGSLSRFWEIEEFDKEPPNVPEIMPTRLRDRLLVFEKGRINYRFHEALFGLEDLVKWVASLPGPRIVILNTVQSAAAVAREYERQFGRSRVEHLSTALTPSDRDATLTRVKAGLLGENDTDWTLIATSCVEAGVDLSFKTGVREAASLVSLLQTAGRVNRHTYSQAETVWTIILREEGVLRKHPAFADASKVLLDLFSEGLAISPALCTAALKKEIRLGVVFSDTLMKYDTSLRFPQVEKDFEVIASETRTVVVGADLINKLENNEPLSWRDIQKSSVQIWGYRLEDLRVPEVTHYPGLYKWTYKYDDFIGIMAGILPVEDFVTGAGGII
jgi:CRISPR-associated endonuclease/helicase Cas3